MKNQAKPERPHPQKLVLLQPLLAWIFWANSVFLTHMDYSYIVHSLKGNLGCLEGRVKRRKISETEEAMLTKLGVCAFHINFYLHKFFESILFFWSPSTIVHVLKTIIEANKKEEGLWNQYLLFLILLFDLMD